MVRGTEIDGAIITGNSPLAIAGVSTGAAVKAKFPVVPPIVTLLIFTTTVGDSFERVAFPGLKANSLSPLNVMKTGLSGGLTKVKVEVCAVVF